MTKVHITLVGGQPAPVYHGIVATRPDKIVYVFSSQSERALEKLKAEVAIPYEDYLLSPTSPREILQLAEKLNDTYKKDEVTVNISSGLKSWSHWFGVVFQKAPNAAVVYMDQNNVLWNYKTMEGTSDFTFDMHKVFRLYGNPIENNYIRFCDYTDADRNILPKIEQARQFNFKDFNQLVTVISKEDENTLKNSARGLFDGGKDGSYVDWEKAKGGKPAKVRLVLYNKYRIKKDFVMKSPHAIQLVFFSGWFEYKIACLLSEWDKAQEICLNCTFPLRPQVPKNEVDIIVNTGTKILFVECKTQIYSPTDIDKFRSVVKGYGGVGSKGLFVTDARMDDVARQKCLDNGILSFSLQDDHKGKSPKDDLIALLDNELISINIK